MTLHDAIVKLLEQKGRPMTTSEIADELNRNKSYTKNNGSLITSFQVHGRTRKYPHLFSRNGSTVSLVDQPINKANIKSSSKKSTTKSTPNLKISALAVEENLMDKKKFKKAGTIDSTVPANPGLYCIRIDKPDNLPGIFYEELKQRKHDIIYIGKASQSLIQRLLNEELRARGHGTFFRSIGSVLGYKPPKGSLVHKKNNKNFKFHPGDEKKIISWINANLLINWIEFSGNIPKVKSELILKYKPLLNLGGNPYAMKELKKLRADCVRIANQIN